MKNVSYLTENALSIIKICDFLFLAQHLKI